VVACAEMIAVAAVSSRLIHEVVGTHPLSECTVDASIIFIDSNKISCTNQLKDK
jgi:hypothetical protein